MEPGPNLRTSGAGGVRIRQSTFGPMVGLCLWVILTSVYSGIALSKGVGVVIYRLLRTFRENLIAIGARWEVLCDRARESWTSTEAVASYMNDLFLQERDATFKFGSLEDPHLGFPERPANERLFALSFRALGNGAAFVLIAAWTLLLTWVAVAVMWTPIPVWIHQQFSPKRAKSGPLVEDEPSGAAWLRREDVDTPVTEGAISPVQVPESPGHSVERMARLSPGEEGPRGGARWPEAGDEGAAAYVGREQGDRDGRRSS